MPATWRVQSYLRNTQRLKPMDARAFFYLVSNMRRAQQEYFKTKDQKLLRVARALEGDVDREIARVNSIVHAMEKDK